MALRAFRPLLAKVRTSRASAPRSSTIAASANAAPAAPAAAAAEPAAAVSKVRPVGLTAPEAARLAANPPIQPQFFTRTKTSAGIGAPVPLSTPQPLDPRHFRLPNVLFKMVRVGPRNVSPVTKPLVGLANSRKQTRGAPIQPRPVPREHDPYLVAFRVPLNFNKLQIRNYLEELYKIDIVSVNTLIYLGKETRNFKTGLLQKKPDYKKAYVTLLHPFKYPTLDEQRNMRTVMPTEDEADRDREEAS